MAGKSRLLAGGDAGTPGAKTLGAYLQVICDSHLFLKYFPHI